MLPAPPPAAASWGPGPGVQGAASGEDWAASSCPPPRGLLAWAVPLSCRLPLAPLRLLCVEEGRKESAATRGRILLLSQPVDGIIPQQLDESFLLRGGGCALRREWSPGPSGLPFLLPWACPAREVFPGRWRRQVWSVRPSARQLLCLFWLPGDCVQEKGRGPLGQSATQRRAEAVLRFSGAGQWPVPSLPLSPLEKPDFLV